LLKKWNKIAVTATFIPCTVKHILKGHFWDKEKVVLYKTGDLLMEIQFIGNVL